MATTRPTSGSGKPSVKDLLKEQVQDLNEQTAQVEAKVQPLRDEIDALQVDIDKLKGRQKDLAAEAREIEQAQLVPLRNELSAAARASGGFALSDGPA
jgi:chromosome segregation ATPase